MIKLLCGILAGILVGAAALADGLNTLSANDGTGLTNIDATKLSGRMTTANMPVDFVGAVFAYANSNNTFTGTNTITIQGITNGNVAASGIIGEFTNSLVAVASAVTLTNGAGVNVTSITLTAGTWTVDANLNISFAAVTTVGSVVGGTSTTSGTVPTDGSESYSGIPLVLGGTTNTLNFASRIVNMTNTQTLYLVCKGAFSVGTEKAWGYIGARRHR